MKEYKDIKKMYKEMEKDIFPDTMSITLGDQTVNFQKVKWVVEDPEEGPQEKGLRYGDNSGQPAAMFKPIDGNFVFGEVECIAPGKSLVTTIELLRALGKHPGMTNMTDVDRALNIIKYFTEEPTVAIMKHNNPCGLTTSRPTILEAYHAANLADRLAAFGGTIALNRPVDKETAEAIVKNYSEVVVAPEYEPGVLEIFSKKKDLRVLRVANMAKLQEWENEIFIEFKALCDGGIILQTNYMPRIKTLDDLKQYGVIPADIEEVKRIDGKLKKTGNFASIQRKPTEKEYADMLFGWLVESGITSNSVIYVKDKVTIGIGTGEQDRVGAAKIARNKAYEKLRDRKCFEKHGMSYDELTLKHSNSNGEEKLKCRDQLMALDNFANEHKGGLIGAVMISDAYFPFRDGADVGLEEGVRAIIQPGGASRDYDTIVACNERNATMIYTGQRSFKH